MLDSKTITQAPEAITQMLKQRSAGADMLALVPRIVELDKQRVAHIQEVEALKAKRNQASQAIAERKRNKEDASELMEEMKTVSSTIKGLDAKVGEVKEAMEALLYQIPNLLHETVPVGASEADNREEAQWGELPSFGFKPKTHDDLGEKLGWLNFKKAAEVSGSRFAFLKGEGARLSRALARFMIDVHLENGFEEIYPPFIVNRKTLLGTGQLPKFEEDLFKVQDREFYLIPTAEVPVTNYHRDEILTEAQLPLKYVAFTPCFRSEAGSYGKDTKGMKRQHQFDKVEMVQFAHPDRSNEALEGLRASAEKILQALQLPYRVVTLCSSDIGFAAHKTYDLEVWSPPTEQYMEISSCSNCGDFQARRANIRFRSAETKKVRHVHTLNGSGLAVGRTLIAVMENYQKEDGSVEVPTVLRAYL